MAVKTQNRSPREAAATNARNFRTFLLMEQFAAKEIGDRIRLARRERGLTQEELAGMSSFSKRSLQDYEAGITTPYRHLREISRLLRRPEEWFLYGEEAGSVANDERLARIERDLAEIRGLLAGESRAEDDENDAATGTG